jgi:DNA polymerase
MRILSLDLETYSGVDLTKCGVYAYTGSQDFEILLLAYAFDDEPVAIIDLASGEQIPDEVLMALTDPNTIKTAFNANFERTCLARYLNTPMPPEQWRCSQAHALTLGLPASLEGVAKCLKLPQQKMSEGKGLIRYFSMPCKPTKTNSGRTRNLPEHDREKWQLFKTYCKQDVEVERAIRAKLEQYPMLEQELKLWFLDQTINDYGVRVDMELVKNAIRCDEMYQEKLVAEAKHLTRLENPNSPAQLKSWLQDKHGIQIESLAKDTVSEILAEVANPIAKRALELRQEMSRTSVKKYEAMDRAVSRDERVRGLLQYYGASTGRWAGRILNPQNLPRNNMSDLDLARRLLSSGDYEALELLFDSVPDVLSQLIRTAFIPSPGHRFIVSDFSAIEARIVAWLAGEKWVIDTFNDHGKIYEMTASKMFRVPFPGRPIFYSVIRPGACTRKKTSSRRSKKFIG